MSRLIDADKLIQEMSEWYWDKEKQKAAENDVSPMDLFTHLAITTVQEQPTAFDLDKVVKQLKDLKAMYWVSIANTGDEKLDVAYEKVGNALDRAIEIVKENGAEREKFFSRQSEKITENGLRDIIRNAMARHSLVLIYPFTVIYLRFFVLL